MGFWYQADHHYHPFKSRKMKQRNAATPVNNPRMRLVTVSRLAICDPCLDGAGGECHAPGCLFWMNRAPDVPIRERLVDYGAEIVEAHL